jgi:hypothetical protein
VSNTSPLIAAAEYFARLAQTPGRIRDERTAARRQQQQEQFLNLYKQFEQQNQQLSTDRAQRDAAIITQQAPALEARENRTRDAELSRTIALNNNQAGLTNTTLTTAGGVASDLLRTDGEVQGGLQGARLAATERLMRGAQDFETGMVDRMVGPVPLAQLHADTALKMQGNQFDFGRYLVDKSQPTNWDRAIQLLGPTALIAAALAK